MDIAARLVAPWLSARLRQPVFVENHPGESGNLATRMVVRAPPDGSTVLLCGPVNTINTTLFADLDFDFTRDIAPVASISRVPLVIEVNPAVRARSLPEFIALAKDRPGQIKVAYAGRGTPQHVGIKLFEMMAGVELTLVPYLGSEPALADLLGGQVQAMFDPMPSSLPHLRAGSLIPLAVTSPSRSEVLSDVPSASECLPDYEAGSWFGLGVPRSTPHGVILKINKVLRAALKDQRMQVQLVDMGASTMSGSPTDFRLHIARETDRLAQVISMTKIG
jgi:tripartite-type tricarboxylate transporter receptor subunit TctC